jgi:hypothetical protein
MKKAWVIYIAVLGLVLGTGKIQAQSIRSKVDTTSILIGNPVHFSFEMELPANTKINFPAWNDSLFNGLTLLEIGKVDTIRMEGKSDLKLTQTLTLTAFDSGDFSIPPITLFINGDSTKPLFTEPYQIKSTFPPVALDKEIKDIKPPIEPAFDWVFWTLIALGILAALVIAWLAFQIFQKKQNPFAKIFEEKPLPPHEKALKKLEELKQKKLWQNGMEKQYHVELSEIVREYIEGRFKVQALEQVTDQTLEEMKFLVSPEVLTMLKQILSLSDLVKFARQQASQGENELSLNNAFELVKRTLPVVELEDKKKEVGNE